jgi:hypothetical protein
MHIQAVLLNVLNPVPEALMGESKKTVSAADPTVFRPAPVCTSRGGRSYLQPAAIRRGI